MLHAQIASEAGQFGFDDVAYGLRQKMLRRNRHIFDEHGQLRGDITQDVATIIETWDAAKAEEQRGRRPRAGLPAGLPALTLPFLLATWLGLALRAPHPSRVD